MFRRTAVVGVPSCLDVRSYCVPVHEVFSKSIQKQTKTASCEPDVSQRLRPATSGLLPEHYTVVCRIYCSNDYTVVWGFNQDHQRITFLSRSLSRKCLSIYWCNKHGRAAKVGRLIGHIRHPTICLYKYVVVTFRQMFVAAWRYWVPTKTGDVA